MLYLGLKDKQVLIYADILGFTKEIYKNRNVTLDDKDEIIVNLPAVYDHISKVYTRKYQFDKGFRFLCASDSIVLASDINNINVILGEYCEIINDFYRYNLTLRGAIVVGELYYEKNIWGPAFLKGLEYEKRAIFPRTIIDKNSLGQLIINENYSPFFKDTESSIFQYFDFFNYQITATKNGLVTKNALTNQLNIYARLINRSLKTFKDDEAVFDKYLWLANSLNENILRHSSFIDSIKEKYYHTVPLKILFDGISL